MIENSAGWRYVQSADSVADYPTVSEHNAGKFQDLKSVVAGKAPLSHTHSTSQVTGLDAALAGKAPLSHTHSTSQVNGLDEALDGKAPVSHTHSTSQVNGLDEALDGKAPVSHTHSTSQVNGLDTALDGKAPLATLNTRVPENLSLRLETRAGTRVFAGNTMIYGDTGWRDVSSYLMPGLTVSSNFGRARIRRIGGRVEFDMKVDVTESGMTSILSQIPTGFRPIPRFPMDNGIFTHTNLGATASQLKAGTHVGVFYNNHQPLQTASATPFPNPGTVAWTGSYPTDDPWPSIVIGLPA